MVPPSLAERYKFRPVLAVLIATMSGWCTPAGAGFNFQTYQNRNSPYFLLLDSTRDQEDIDKNPLLNSSIYHYFSNPIDYVEEGTDQKGSFVSGIHSLNTAGEYQVWNRVSFGLEASLHQLTYHGQGTQFSFGDIRTFSKISLNHKTPEKPKLSFVPSIYLPTGNSELLLSNPQGGAGGTVVLEKSFGRWLAAVNMGAVHFPNARESGINYDTQLSIGAGASYKASEKWKAQSEWAGRLIHGVRTGDFSCNAQYQVHPEQSLLFGASLASTKFDHKNLEYRLLFGIRWSPSITKIKTERIHTKIKTIEKIETIHDCGPKPYTAVFAARELSEEEKNWLKEGRLPYISTRKKAFQTLRLGGKNGLVDGNISVVKNAQVLFAVDLVNLPPRNTVIAMKNLDLAINVRKYWKTPEDRTGMLCLINEKICSGDHSMEASLLEHINFGFFSGKEPPNDYFLRQIPSAQQTKDRSAYISKAQLKLPMARLLENAIMSEPMNVLYDPTGDPRIPSSKTLYFAVAHDFFVNRKAQIEVELSVQFCTEGTSAPSIEIQKEESKTEVPQ